jgi:hypothetical protein
MELWGGRVGGATTRRQPVGAARVVGKRRDLERGQPPRARRRGGRWLGREPVVGLPGGLSAGSSRGRGGGSFPLGFAAMLAGTAGAGGSEPGESSSHFMSTSMVCRRCGPGAGRGGGCFACGAGGGSERMSQEVSTSIVLRRTGAEPCDPGRVRFLAIPPQNTGRQRGTLRCVQGVQNLRDATREDRRHGHFSRVSP